ncbi:hypothetical protein ACIRPU_34495 [Streptomyces sp. NPDC102259]|uniref:hypothetical protein n=1 Tax=Streptomyces sp. NPDC102259 TaxID=3366148 RepID=UPI00380437EC
MARPTRYAPSTCDPLHPLHLRPEDLVARTIESAATARVPLTGTGRIPGEGL